jgi:hypothetical protein
VVTFDHSLVGITPLFACSVRSLVTIRVTAGVVRPLHGFALARRMRFATWD